MNTANYREWSSTEVKNWLEKEQLYCMAEYYEEFVGKDLDYINVRDIRRKLELTMAEADKFESALHKLITNKK